MHPRTFSTGIDYLDALLGGLKAGDNVVWEADSGAPVEFFTRSFLKTAAQTDHGVLFVSFTHSPQSVINRYVTEELRPRLHLLDAFTSGFGKDNEFFADFYRSPEAGAAVSHVPRPADTEGVSNVIDRLTDSTGEGTWYVFDSLTAMFNLWGEEAFLKFFGYLCPKLYDLGSIAYWIAEKQAHSPAFLARLMHITQVVLEIGTGEEGIGLTIRKAEDRPASPVGVPHYFLSVDGHPESLRTRREALEMRLLREISLALGSSLDLNVVFDGIMQILAAGLDMHRGTLVLEDAASSTFRIAAAHGLSDAEMAKGVYRLGEGITGTVIQDGRAVVVPDIRHDPRFLDRTGARGKLRTGPPVSFVCVPLSIGQEVIGALSIDREFIDTETLSKDERLLQIVGSMIAQAIKIHRMVGVDKEELLKSDGPPAPESRYAVGSIVAASPKMREALSLTRVVARSNSTVLIQGETGTGKELIAHIIHNNSPRRDKPFVAVNCGALPDTLLESELFGHVRGSFTGAVRDRAGRFALADGGTIFLDEVASMSNQLQVRLLRVLQEKTFEPVGSSEAVKVNVRVVGATNVDLAQKVDDGEFREDLYYRLNVVPIHLPPLRERREDIPRLTEHFMDVFSRQNDKQVNRMSREALDLLMSYDWPGNVRELENCMERAIVLCQTGTIGADLLPDALRTSRRRPRPMATTDPREALRPLIAHLRHTTAGNVLGAAIEFVEEAVVRAVLQANEGVQTRAARELGISRNTLRDRIRAYRI
ncbi:MAG: sigma 54-interacting transcriptional regulator [Candidatus Brocadiaceae bacterium]|nr:sigma 54-interacting transcriptional regulator [Candidatus Brocadiaceae bacterium]